MILICSPFMGVTGDPDVVIPSLGMPQFLANILTDGGNKVVDGDVVIAPHLIHVVGRDVTTESEPTQDTDGSWLRPLSSAKSGQSVGTTNPDTRRPVTVPQHEAVGEEHIGIHPPLLDVIVEQGVTYLDVWLNHRWSPSASIPVAILRGSASFWNELEVGSHYGSKVRQPSYSGVPRCPC